MGKLQQKLYRFMYGRYGVDKLYKFCSVLIIIALLLNVITSIIIKNNDIRFVVSTVILLFEIFLLVWSTFRCFSKNIYKRRRENERFIKMTKWLSRLFTCNTSRKSKSGNVDNDHFIFRDCTKCGATLRLPRKPGRNKVKCPRCSHKFYVFAKKAK